MEEKNVSAQSQVNTARAEVVSPPLFLRAGLNTVSYRDLTVGRHVFAFNGNATLDFTDWNNNAAPGEYFYIYSDGATISFEPGADPGFGHVKPFQLAKIIKFQDNSNIPYAIYLQGISN